MFVLTDFERENSEFEKEWKWGGSGVRRLHVRVPQRVVGAANVRALLETGVGVCVSGSTLLAPFKNTYTNAHSHWPGCEQNTANE